MDGSELPERCKDAHRWRRRTFHWSFCGRRCRRSPSCRPFDTAIKSQDANGNGKLEKIELTSGPIAGACKVDLAKTINHPKNMSVLPSCSRKVKTSSGHSPGRPM